jgi:multiple sugar transport system ATP-binding protein
LSAIRFESVTKTFPDGTVAVDGLSLDIADGECMVFVGPSGCGKTTALRMLAGLETLSTGEIYIGERPMSGVDPSDRDIAMVFQNYALYPQMLVRQNMSFPLKMRKIPKAEIEKRVLEVARMLSIENLLERRPGELSGGQRQRVAIGRAICRNPEAFLLDEPLSNLDAKLRVLMRAELTKLQQQLGVTTLYVTHDQTEAMTIGHRVAVMRGGTVQQVGSPRDLYDQPANAFVAGFIGSPPMNFAEVAISGETIQIGSSGFSLPPSLLARMRDRVDGPALLGLRPEAIRDPAASGRDSAAELEALIDVIEPLGAETHAYLRIPNVEASPLTERPPELAGTFAARFESRFEAAPGDRITVGLDLDSCCLFDPQTQDSLLAPEPVAAASAQLTR